ncbi:MAG: cobalamin B12-binding domain-containing protein [Chloroflexi bacterium]|nr:MAG: cobalamin B12-binding domain-containing protein [Chloroflexota bacterium]
MDHGDDPGVQRPVRAYARARRSGSDGRRARHRVPTARRDGQWVRPIRVVVAKAGLDGHDRGAKVVARALRDAGMEVIYTGVHQTPEQVVETALQEDADAIGLSLLSGAHNYIFPRISELMKEKGLDDVLLFGGGIIPEADWPALRKVGVERVFPPGATLEEITTYVREAVPKKRGVEV